MFETKFAHFFPWKCNSHADIWGTTIVTKQLESSRCEQACGQRKGRDDAGRGGGVSSFASPGRRCVTCDNSVVCWVTVCVVVICSTCYKYGEETRCGFRTSRTSYGRNSRLLLSCRIEGDFSSALTLTRPWHGPAWPTMHITPAQL